MSRHWRFAPHDRGVVARISHELRCSPLLAEVLAARGMQSGADARTFLDAKLVNLHEPDLLPGIPEAADRVVSALKCGRRITVYGDYDVDGVTGTSILWHCLKLAGGAVDYYIPSRLEEGYGLNLDAIRHLHQADPQRLLITVDCGIGSLREAQLARELGLELVVTDHHTLASELPAAACCVHPRLPQSPYPFGDLCGAGVAFKLAWAVCQRLGDGKRATPAMREFLMSAVGLAAIGTIADVVPLVGENRILVRYGLTTLHDRPIIGLSMLLKVSGLGDNRRLTAEDIGFNLAPRINAAGRLGQARLAVELLTTDNHTRAAQLANYVDQLNKNRQTVERRMFRQAKELIAENGRWQDDGALVLAHPEWHPGVIGIVAGRIAEHYQRPAVMIAVDDEQQLGQGSGRSFSGFDLHAALSACRDHLETFGGHRAAAGLRIRRERIDAFREALVEFVRRHSAVTQRDMEVRVDAEVSLAELTHRAVKELEWLGPFGSEHQRPRFAATRVELAQPPRRMGGGDRHLALRVRQGNTVLRAVAFGNGDWADDLARRSGPISICFTANLNRYQGYDRVELQLIDWQADQTAPAAMRAASQNVESSPAAGLDSSALLPTETAVRT